MLSNPEEAANTNFNYELPSLNAIEDKISILERFLSNQKSLNSSKPNMEPITSDSLPHKKPPTKNPKMPPQPSNNKIPSEKNLPSNYNLTNANDKNVMSISSHTNNRNNISNKSNINHEGGGSNMNVPPVQFTNAQIRSQNNEGDVTQSGHYNPDEKALAPKFVEMKRTISKKTLESKGKKSNRDHGKSEKENSVKRITHTKDSAKIEDSNKKRSASKNSKSRSKRNKINVGRPHTTNIDSDVILANEKIVKGGFNVKSRSTDSLRKSTGSKNSARKNIKNQKNSKDAPGGATTSNRKTFHKPSDRNILYEETELSKNMNNQYKTKIDTMLSERSAKLEKELELL